jgi:DNA repair protein RecN (Recombination protein N)
MLKKLYIKNFTLIDELDIDFHQGFSVITGETGAGKSIILGAIGLLLGQRADSKSIKQGADRCVIEAHFDLSRYDMEQFFNEAEIDYDPEDCIVRRELTATGKSRAFVNDIPVQLSTLKELGDQLIDIHSQHQNLLLNKQDFQLSVVDVIAGDANELKTYQQTFEQYLTAKKELEAFRQNIERNRQNQDFLQFQFDELTNANLDEDEQEELEQKCETMSHSEEIKTALYTADNLLSADMTGVVGNLHAAYSALKGVEKVYPAVSELVERVNSSYIEVKDFSSEISSQLERIDFDPAELDRINSRLDTLYDLEKKYHVETVAELIAKRDEIKSQLSDIENCDEQLAEMEQRLGKQEKQLKHDADVLTKLRSQAVKSIEKDMLSKLAPLGMPNIRFVIQMTASDAFSPTGQDKVTFLFSANTSTPLQPIAQVASGGEIARVMLSLKAMISAAVKLPTIIFDEIDTGVSGKIAEKMAEIMREMGQKERQVISITHLPQIAALGTTHYRVEKEDDTQRTTSRMKELTTEERIREIAQMLSGTDITEAAIQNAKQLLRL